MLIGVEGGESLKLHERLSVLNQLRSCLSELVPLVNRKILWIRRYCACLVTKI